MQRFFRQPSAWQDDEAPGGGAAPDDFNVELGDAALGGLLKRRAAVSAVGIELEQEGVEAKKRGHDQRPAVAVPGLRRGRL